MPHILISYTQQYTKHSATKQWAQVYNYIYYIYYQPF